MKTTQNKLADALRLARTDLEQWLPNEAADDATNAALEAVCAALAEHDAAKPGFTVFVQDDDGTGTTYITHVEAADVEAAKSAALVECAEAWRYEDDENDRAIDRLRVVGVAAGDVTICEWDDCE